MLTPRKTELKQYFTDAEDLNALMAQLLGPVDGLHLLEPSVGHGALLKGLIGTPAKIDIVDIDPSALAVTQANFPKLKLAAHHCDFIDVFARQGLLDMHPLAKAEVDAVIANPPYGLYLDLAYRRQLKKAFPHLYVRESFGLFLVFALERLKPGGKYVFLIPDTFLTSKNHTPLRRFLCAQGAPTHILRFPSKKFETVNFGYGNLCIIAGERRALQPEDGVAWSDATDAKPGSTIQPAAKEIRGDLLLRQAETGWSAIGLAPPVFSGGQWTTLGAVAECRTGIYTGDNERFIGFDPARSKRRINGHPIAWDREVHCGDLSEAEKARGLATLPHYVPLIRGGHRACFEQTPYAIQWNTDAVHFYGTDRKARLQNAAFYFREGLSVPMVSSGRISAALMQGAVFDQGVVGIFPEDSRWIAALLLYLNSSLASKLMKGLVNGSANNSANYLKKLPVPAFTEGQLDAAAALVDAARSGLTVSSAVCEEFVAAAVGLLSHSTCSPAPRRRANLHAGPAVRSRRAPVPAHPR